MNYWQLISCLFATSSLALAGDELPLPVFGPLPERQVEESSAFLRPTAVVKPPAVGPVTVAPALNKPNIVIKPPASGPVRVAGAAISPVPVSAPAALPRVSSRQIAAADMDRLNHELKIRQQIAEAHSNGRTTALRRVIVMSGPLDSSVGLSPTPPAATEDGGKIALIGIPMDVVVTKNLEPFFGAPVTPDSEQRLLEAVKSHIAAQGADVRIAGWWPNEGVMAVTVVPKGS